MLEREAYPVLSESGIVHLRKKHPIGKQSGCHRRKRERGGQVVFRLGTRESPQAHEGSHRRHERLARGLDDFVLLRNDVLHMGDDILRNEGIHKVFCHFLPPFLIGPSFCFSNKTEHLAILAKCLPQLR